MHIRTSRVTRNGKTYAYAQLVESFRRPDGVPAHRVVANLGQLLPDQIANLKTALVAGRHGDKLVADTGSAPRAPVANLRYLDLAVLLELSRECGLEALLASLLPKGESVVAPSDVVLALVLQRCVDPGSKLYAERWFPRTALPELFAIAPENFNNTRLHRVLGELDTVTPELMTRLPQLYLEKLRTPTFATLYVDLTDAAFVGHGPELARRGKTKEGVLARKIGILLLCNDRGYPLRWRVVEGNSSDSTVMSELFAEISKTPWAQKTPILCDRAMGRTALIRSMAATGLHFVTSLAITEMDTYASRLPYASFSEIEARDQSDGERARAIEAAGKQAQEAGLELTTDGFWVTNLGVVDIDAVKSDSAPNVDTVVDSPSAHFTIVGALKLARAIDQAVQEGRFSSYVAAGGSLGLTESTTKKYRRLLKLTADVQEAIASREADRCSLAELLRIARQPASHQQERFQEVLRVAQGRTAKAVAPGGRSAERKPIAPLRVRVAVYFNPERFVDQRQTEKRQRESVDVFVRDLNARLTNGRSQLSKDGIAAAVDRRLRRDDLLDAYDVGITSLTVGERVHYQVTLEPVAKAWHRRRRHHGFTVLVAHADVAHSATELCQLYRAKDSVEKDFQTIKSVVDLRPIRHRTDEKVRAHVTLCMLALLLERRLEHKLAGHASAPSAIETLEPARLNQYRGSRGTYAYVPTETNTEQRALLRKLGLSHVADRGYPAARVVPRFAPTDLNEPA